MDVFQDKTYLKYAYICVMHSNSLEALILIGNTILQN